MDIKIEPKRGHATARLIASAGIKFRLMHAKPSGDEWRELSFAKSHGTDLRTPRSPVMLINRDELRNLEITPSGQADAGSSRRGKRKSPAVNFR